MHPSDKQLIEYLLDGDLPAEARSLIAKHLGERCPECRERARAYEDLLEIMRSDRTPEPPAPWVDRAVAVFSRSPILDRVREWCAGLREEIGRMITDSWTGPDLALGVRSTSLARRMRFESGDVELDLQIDALGRGGTIAGQFARLTPEPEPVRNARYLVTTGDREMVTGVTDELGEFTEELPDISGLCIRAVVDDRLVTFAVPGPPPA